MMVVLFMLLLFLCAMVFTANMLIIDAWILKQKNKEKNEGKHT